MARPSGLHFACAILAACFAVCVLNAAEYHGAVKSGSLPVPGAVVTASQADRKLTTTTNEQGVFSFADLPDGVWNLTVDMLGFARLSHEVGVAAVAPSPEWELKILSREALQSSLHPSGAPTASGGSAGPAPRTPAAPGPPPQQPRAAQLNGSRGPAAPQRGGFQRLDLSQSADTASFGAEGLIRTDEAADLNQSAANSFVVQGSMSSALGVASQNDWHFGGPGGMDPMMMMMGGTGLGGPGMLGPGVMGAGSSNGDGPPMGGPRGPGGPGGPGMGGPGMRGPGMGGPGGPGMGGPGMGGPGSHEGGRDRGGWQGRPNAMAFGNNRRDPRGSYNGSVFLGFNNSFWDAKTYSVTGAEVLKPSYSDLRGGLMFGGPLRIPKLVSAEKRIFFSLNYMFERNRTGTTSQPVNMPTGLERSGDFSQTTIQGVPAIIYDPRSGLPFAGNKIPTSLISSASTGLLQYYPLPNQAFAGRNYQTAWSGSRNFDNLNARLSNIRLGSKDRIEGGVGYQGRNSTTPNLFQFVDSGSGRGINVNTGWTHNLSAKLINSLRYTFSRSRDELSPYFAYRTNVAADLGIAGTSQNPANWGPPNLGFTNYAGLSDGNLSLNRNQTGAVNESFVWIHGNHTRIFGADYRRQQFNQLSDQNGRGAYSFNGITTSTFVNGIAQSGTGYDLADFLLGLPATASIRYGNPDKYFRGSGYSLFANDDWRINTKFTIVAGLRWDYTAPVTELYSRLVNLDVAPGFTAAVPIQPGQAATWSGELGDALIRPDRNNFSPRFGFAWRPLTAGSLVVRGGYGLYYNTSVYNKIASNMAQQPPLAQSLSASTSAALPLTIASGFLLASSQTGLGTYAIDPNYRLGYVQTFSFSVQNTLPLGMFATVGYLATKGTRLDQQFTPNSVAPGAAASTLPNSFIYETSNGNSIYHAAQFQLNRRFRSGIGANASYQFSKSIDNAGTGGRGQGGTPVAQNWLDLSAERGLSPFDSRHNLNLNFQYSTGMGRSGGTLVNGWKGALMKDWTVSGNITVRSGTPFTATVGGNRSQVAGTAVNNTVRANATGLPVSVDGLLFNTAAFSQPAAGLWGNAGRNTIPGPTVFFLNGSVGRIFRIGERHSIDLQLQAQNLLNHVAINSWSTVLGSNNYGLATGAADMRKITANLRFRF